LTVIPGKEIEEIKIEELKIEETTLSKSKIVREDRLRFKMMCEAFPEFKEKLSFQVNEEYSTTSDYSRGLSELAWAILLREIDEKLLRIIQIPDLASLTTYLSFDQ
jgi:hypothetical protein